MLTQSRVQPDRAGHHLGAGRLGAGPLVAGVRDVHRHRAHRLPAGRLRLGLVAGEPVAAEQRALGERPQRGRRVLVVRHRQGQRHPLGAGQRADRGAGGPAQRLRCGAAPVGSGPRPTAATSGAVTVPRVASLVTSPGAPVAPSNASVSVSLPSKATAMASAPVARSRVSAKPTGAVPVPGLAVHADHDRIDGKFGGVGVDQAQGGAGRCHSASPDGRAGRLVGVRRWKLLRRNLPAGLGPSRRPPVGETCRC